MLKADFKRCVKGTYYFLRLLVAAAGI